MRRLILLIGICLLAPFAAADAVRADEISTIAIQHNGRVQSFEGFSRKILRLVANKGSFEGMDASRFIFSLMAEPQKAASLRWIRVDHPELKSKLGLEADRRFFALGELWPHQETLFRLAAASQELRDRDERPSPLLQAAETLAARIQTVHAVETRQIFAVGPPQQPGALWSWPDPATDPLFASILAARVRQSPDTDHLIAEWNRAVLTRSPEARAARITAESVYFRVKPFALAWAIYLITATAAATFLSKRTFFSTSLLSSLFVAAFAFHSAGLALRIAILNRPPVSNMYESMIFMTWATFAFAGIFALIYRNRTPLIAAAVIAGLVLIYADLLPIDPGLDVLVPVLRSNYWLSVHVLTIVSSYGAFGLACALGHRHLARAALNRLTPAEESASALVIRRVIEFGAILIGVGTVLGGIWANESWGRFWGWDPKETWALITLLGYLIIIHLWYFKRIRAFGLAVGSILGFVLVLMTWYGVNFLLGRGLHSYGSGHGGASWIGIYLAFEALFLTWAALTKRRDTNIPAS